MNRKEVHVIAGLGNGLFDRGTRALDKLFDDLSPLWDATHWYHSSWEKIVEGIVKRAQRYEDDPTIILVGHSYGALRCQQIATRLMAYQLQIAYIAGIDPTALPMGHDPMKIPRNVGRVSEFWSTTWFPFNMPYIRRCVTPDGSRGGKYIYKNPDTERKIHNIKGGHIHCASDPKTRKIILENVRELL